MFQYKDIGCVEITTGVDEPTRWGFIAADADGDMADCIDHSAHGLMQGLEEVTQFDYESEGLHRGVNFPLSCRWGKDGVRVISMFSTARPEDAGDAADGEVEVEGYELMVDAL